MYKEKELELNICKKKILIVDDEPINLEFFEIMLSKLGFEVGKAIDGLDALEKVVAFEPDLILLDIIMPKLTGWEFTKKLRNDEEFEKYSNIPIIMFSGMCNVNGKIEGLELGVDDYITKPFVFREVLFRIRAVLRHRELALQYINLKTKHNKLLGNFTAQSVLQDKLTSLIFDKNWGLMLLKIIREAHKKYLFYLLANLNSNYIGQLIENENNEYIVIDALKRIQMLEEILKDWFNDLTKKSFKISTVYGKEIGQFENIESILTMARKKGEV